MARKYRVTVNGKAYDVNVEEMGAGAPVAAPAPVIAAPVAAPMAAPAPVDAPAPVAAVLASGAARIEAPMPGKVLKILVTEGASVTAGQLVLLLEAMKMENEIYATEGGTVTQLCCKEGDSVNTGDPLLVIG